MDWGEYLFEDLISTHTSDNIKWYYHEAALFNNSWDPVFNFYYFWENSLFAAIPILAGDLSENKKADSSKNRLQCNEVPFTGLSSNIIFDDLKLFLIIY